MYTSAKGIWRYWKCRKSRCLTGVTQPRKKSTWALPEFTDLQTGKQMRSAGIEVEVIDEKCWKGYEKKMKTMFGKRYPNCVKKEEIEQVKEGDGDPWPGFPC